MEIISREKIIDRIKTVSNTPASIEDPNEYFENVAYVLGEIDIAPPEFKESLYFTKFVNNIELLEQSYSVYFTKTLQLYELKAGLINDAWDYEENSKISQDAFEFAKNTRTQERERAKKQFNHTLLVNELVMDRLVNSVGKNMHT